MKPIDFVLGTGRCGSTLVCEVLCQHESMGFISNFDDRSSPLGRLAGANGRLYRRLPPGATTKGRLRFAPSEAYEALAREVSPMLKTSVRDLDAGDASPWVTERLVNFFDTRAELMPEPRLLHKFTGWPRALFLNEAFPQARYVHVVRDGRAVVNSWLQMPWWLGHLGPDHWHFGPLDEEQNEIWESSGRSFAVLAALGWQLLIDRMAAVRDNIHPESWLEIRYEDFVADPAGLMDQVLAFLGADADPGFADRLARYTFSNKRNRAFETDLAPATVGAIEAVMDRGLRQYRYI